jgi:hypothetical protein
MSRAALQLEYTSCRCGQRGGKGFQTRAASPGIRPDEQHEIEGQGGYTPPRDAPSEPTWEVIEHDFPVLFRYYQIASGRFAITRAQYTGRDYSERWGNFFAHTLVVEDGPLERWPIDYYEWPGWKRRLELHEDTETVPDPLPDVALDAIEASPSFALAELQAFLHEVPARVGTLAAMIRAVFFGQSRARMLVVRDSALNGAFWIGCVQKAFPLRHALGLTQSTYQFDARDCAALNATTEGTGFSFDETQRNFQFCMFDLVEGISSDVPDDEAEYASTVAHWMADQPARLGAFHAFMAGIDHAALDSQLVRFLRVFRMIEGDELAVGEMIDALEIVSPYLSASARVPLCAPLGRAAEWAAAHGSPEELLAILRFLTEGADAAPDRPPVAQTWLRCFETARAAQRWMMLPVLSECRDAIAARAPDAERGIAVLLMSAGELDAVGASLAAMPADADVAIEWLLGEVLRSAQAVGVASDSAALQGVIAAARARAGRIPASAAALLRAFGSDTRGLAAACATLAFGGGADVTDPEVNRRGDITGRALYDVLQDAPEAARAGVRRALDRPETWTVLFGEWRATLAANRRGTALYAEYRDRVLSAVPGFDRVARGEIARTFAETLEPVARAATALAWFESGEVNRFPADMQTWCVDAAAATIRLTRDATGGDTASLVAERARRLGMTLEPDRPFLRWLLDAASRPNATMRSLGLERLPAAMHKLERAEYGAFMRAFLPPALTCADDDGAHEELLQAAFLRTEEQLFTEAYTAAIAAVGRDALQVQAVVAALRFWLVRAGDRGVDGSAALLRPALEALATRLARMSRAELQKVERGIKVADAFSPAHERWTDMRQEVERRRRSFVARVGDMFRGK